MKIFSEKVNYGVSAMFELAKNYYKGHIQIKEIAKNHNIPHNYLEKLLIDLKRADLVESIRGSKGGYKLKKPASNIKIIDLIEALEGPISIFNYTENSEVLQIFWKNIEENLIKLFNDSLEKIVEEDKKLQDKLFFQI